MLQHVVNNVIGTVAMTVAHCNIAGCTHVDTMHGRSEPLYVSQAGFRDGEMFSKIKGVYHQHPSGEPIEPDPGSPPFSDEGYRWIQTTWKEWSQHYPETDIYLELPPENPPP